MSVNALSRDANISRPQSKARLSFAWIGLAPFALFSLLFLVLPTSMLLAAAFQDNEGHWSLVSLGKLFQPALLNSYMLSIDISAVSAILGVFFGFFLAYSLVAGQLPPSIRTAVMTFCGVASNFAGVPLAFAFLATLGRLGVVTLLLDWAFGFNLYRQGFNVISFTGLTLAYLYFQIPLMVLIIVPAIEGLRKEWREAATILGAGSFYYWRHIALPLLGPSLLGAGLLLFANAFGAVATAFALTGSSYNITPIELYNQIRGDVLHDANLGYALALSMVAITALSNIGYLILRARSDRWVK